MIFGTVLAGIAIFGVASALYTVREAKQQRAALEADLVRALAAFRIQYPSAISPSGSFVARSDFDGIVVIDSTHSGRLPITIVVGELVNALTFFPDEIRIAIATNDSARVFRITDGLEILRHAMPGAVKSISVSPDGTFLFATTLDGQFDKIDATTGSVLSVAQVPAFMPYTPLSDFAGTDDDAEGSLN